MSDKVQLNCSCRQQLVQRFRQTPAVCCWAGEVRRDRPIASRPLFQSMTGFRLLGPLRVRPHSGAQAAFSCGCLAADRRHNERGLTRIAQGAGRAGAATAAAAFVQAACGARGGRRRAGGLPRCLQQLCWGTPPDPSARARVLPMRVPRGSLVAAASSGFLFETPRSLPPIVAAAAQWCDGSLRPLLTVGRTRCPSSWPAHWPDSWLVVVLPLISSVSPRFSCFCAAD